MWCANAHPLPATQLSASLRPSALLSGDLFLLTRHARLLTQPFFPSPSLLVHRDRIAGTDWSLITTDDGKKYYFNVVTQVGTIDPIG